MQISGHYNVNMHDSEFVMGNFGENSPSLFINKWNLLIQVTNFPGQFI